MQSSRQILAYVFQESRGGPWGWSSVNKGKREGERKGKRDQRGQILQDSTDLDETLWLICGGDEQKDILSVVPCFKGLIFLTGRYLFSGL